MNWESEAITYLEGVHGVTKKYAEGRLVWVDKDRILLGERSLSSPSHAPPSPNPAQERKMPLADLPYMAKGLESVEAGQRVWKSVVGSLFVVALHPHAAFVRLALPSTRRQAMGLLGPPRLHALLQIAGSFGQLVSTSQPLPTGPSCMRFP